MIHAARRLAVQIRLHRYLWCHRVRFIGNVLVFLLLALKCLYLRAYLLYKCPHRSVCVHAHLDIAQEFDPLGALHRRP